jgi:hypothetical protein
MKEHVLLWQAIHALEIDVPVLSSELLGAEAVRLHLYGGRVVEYAVPRAAPPPQAPLRQKSPRAGREPAQDGHPGAAAPPTPTVSKAPTARPTQPKGGRP